ncbi:MAG: S26 family signal peptidase [Rhodospirillales bacterium]|nr:S26 family signal peptidase [Rhodospirillales bacterium]MDE0377624.1 S26 family signal peptidase [Rhodospirillales bacterium]
MTAPRPIFGLRKGASRRRHVGLAVMVALAALWLVAVSRVHVNASWSDEAWGYAAFPLFGEEPAVGDRVLFEPPKAVGSRVPYLKTVRGVPGMMVSVDADGTVRLDGVPAGRAKSHARDGRPLAAIAPGIIPAGHFYLHADHADSHDSRYAGIGLVPRTRILGRAVAMPDLPWLGLKGPLVGPEDAGPAAGPATVLPYPADGPFPRDAGAAPSRPPSGDGP